MTSKARRPRRQAEQIIVVTCVLILGACSAILDYEECKESKDCSYAGMVCLKGYCVEEAQDSESVSPIKLLDNGCTRVYGTSVEQALEEKTILLGSLLPYTGDMKAYGPRIAEGIELAVDEINQAGGILNKKLAVLMCNDGTDIAVAEKAARHIASLNRIPAVIGPASSEATLETFTKVFKDAGIAVISPSATSPMITTIQDEDLLWRTVPSDAIQGEAIGEFLLRKMGSKKIAIIHRSDAYGTGLHDAIQNKLCLDFPCADEQYFFSASYEDPLGAEETSSIIDALHHFAPDITVLISYFEDGSTILKSAAEKGIIKFLLADGMKTEELSELMLPDSLFCRLSGTQPATSSGNNFQSFTVRFSAKYDEVGSYSANAYDATYLLAYAIAASNVEAPTGHDVKGGLARLSSGDIVNAGISQWNSTVQRLSSTPTVSINYEGASGPLDFDKFGDVRSDIEAWSFDIDEKAPFSVGILYTDDGVYQDILDDSPGRGAACDTPTD